MHFSGIGLKYLPVFAYWALLLTTACKKDCHNSFSEKELSFVAYAKGQTIQMTDSNNVVHTLQQTKYRREESEDWGQYGRSGNYKEVYAVQYRSTTKPDFGFDLNLYSRNCDGTRAWLFIQSADLVTYGSAQRGWILEADPNAEEVKYASRNINGTDYTNVYELKGYDASSQAVTMFFNKAAGILEISFASGKKITLR